MRLKLLPILLIVVIAMALVATSFHCHADIASLVKCPTCSGKYVSASTHLTVEPPLVVRPAAEAAPPAASKDTCCQALPRHTFHTRAPPSPRSA